ncbi:MAG: nicotinate-nucleotide--dimethylbenzimidazole phosphoribosyltransferase [Saccharofermentanales bacterium]
MKNDNDFKMNLDPDFDLYETIKLITKPDESCKMKAKERWNNIAKPLNSLGKLEDLVVKAAGIFGNEAIDFSRKGVIVMCADNGVVDEGVTQVSNEVTATVARNMTNGKATINILSSKNGADVFVIDIGIACDMSDCTIINRKISSGTRNMALEPTMSKAETIKAIETGISMVYELKSRGYRLIATGEMGIGNTTTSSAVTAVILGKSASEVTGRGAGLSDKSLLKKIQVIDHAIALHKPDPFDPIDVMAKVGGLDIAGLAGVFIGGAAAKIPVLIDGFISSVAALAAIRICPDVREYIYATHISYEPAGRMVLDALGLPAFLDLNMCLGEGTGAVMAFPIFDLAVEVYNKMASFEEANIETYVPQETNVTQKSNNKLETL